ncbi:proline--tRNA ligase [Algimonas ampicilliniresistens]|uniref:Proline--tRNA ligase n=1 Tax=Algimonas ampicilliniresistens TaxID=1298735 RepID=A0ABQ5VAS5_9PROT|nr:proline--tRNA ligase [Algimonas ampicilliniresistens]GLQ23437.1 proline--tRNA ligase [Algimonas ampicilliniresistens]
MRLSRYFLPLLKETPSDATIASHQLMLRAGMVRQNSAGIYTWLPLGHKVLKRIEQIVREEQNRAGAIEMLMPTIQSAELWKKSGRYDAYGPEMLRITDRHDREMLFGPTNEEMLTDVFSSFVRSYKDLPKILYHVQWKFRDERRPRFGVMRGREFLMKDAYSFDVTPEEARKSYNKMFVAYLNTFERLGLKAIPVRADTGPIGGDLSHEFVILAESGESAVYAHRDLVEMDAPGTNIDFDGDLQSVVDERTAFYSAADEMHDAEAFAAIPEDKRMEARGIEVGHIFYFGTKYSEPFDATVMGPDGKPNLVEMGSYGIGVSRLVGGIIEASHDENGIIWPTEVSPFDVGIINMRAGDAECDAACDDFYAKAQAAGLDPLYDDTSDRGGVKFSRMDLIGLPYQIIIGPRGLKDGIVEVKTRKTGERENLSPDAALAKLTA